MLQTVLRRVPEGDMVVTEELRAKQDNWPLYIRRVYQRVWAADKVKLLPCSIEKVETSFATETCLATRERIIIPPNLPYRYNKENTEGNYPKRMTSFSAIIKYMGWITDVKFNFQGHVDYGCKKATAYH